MRMSTSSRIFSRPLTAPEAHEAVGAWLQQPNAGVIEPGDRHQEILGRLLASGQASGALVMDAALAAIDHGATLCSTDRDFSRFDGLDWHNPIAT